MNNTATLDAVHALRARGVDQAEQLLELGDPEELLELCGRFDARDGRVGPGWIVSEARAGHFTDPEPPPTPPTPEEQHQAKFAAALRRLPPGTAIWRHAEMEPPHRLEECPGLMRVEESTYPTLTIACTVCLDTVAVPVRLVHALKPIEPDQDDPF